MSKVVSDRIRQLEAQVQQLRTLGRTKRDPIDGLGGTIQRLREERKLGVRELAEKSGMNAGAISRLEQDPKANPQLATFISIAAGLSLSGSSLMAYHESVSIVGKSRQRKKA